MTIAGVDIGGTKVLGGLLDGGRLAGAVSLRHDRLAAGADGLLPLTRRIAEVVTKVAAGRSVDAVGVSVSGPLSADRTRITNSTLQLSGAPLAAAVAAELGVPVTMENDGNCAAWAEYAAGAGAGRNPFVLLTLGTGVGGGIIWDGRVLRGRHGAAAELGHLPINPDGPACACGGVGCLELYASGRALVRAFAATGPELPGDAIAHVGPFDRTGLAAIEAAFARALAAGEEPARQALAGIAAALATGIFALAKILDPELFALGGGLSALGQPLLDAVHAAIEAAPGMTPPVSDIPVVLARHRNDAGALGAALLAAAPGRW